MADKNFKIKTGLDLPAPLPATQGGTGQSTLSNALNAMMPIQSSHSGKYLSTDGTNPSWATINSVGTLSSLNVVNGIISVDNSGNQIHLHAGSASSTPTTIFRNDGNGFHILLTDAGAISGGFNSYRPFVINNYTGRLSSSNGQDFYGGTIIAATINPQTTTAYTSVYSDAGAITTMNSSSANTFSIPTNASVPFPVGCSITIIQIGSGITTISAVSPGTTNISSNAGTSNAPKMRTQFSSATAIKISNAPEVWYVVGDIV